MASRHLALADCDVSTWGRSIKTVDVWKRLMEEWDVLPPLIRLVTFSGIQEALGHQTLSLQTLSTTFGTGSRSMSMRS